MMANERRDVWRDVDPYPDFDPVRLINRAPLVEWREKLRDEVHRFGGPRKSELVVLGKELDRLLSLPPVLASPPTPSTDPS